MKKLYIVGLGNGLGEDITLRALNILKQNRHVYVQTLETPVAAFLRCEGIELRPMDDLYAQTPDFDALNDAIAQRLTGAVLEQGSAVYAVLGGGYLGNAAWPALEKAAQEHGFELELIEGAGGAESAAMRVKGQSTLQMQVCYAAALDKPVHSGIPLCVMSVYSKLAAGEAKLHLLQYYPPETEVSAVFIRDGELRHTTCALHEIDRDLPYSHTLHITLPALELTKRVFALNDLVEVMDILRSQNGCPWDKEQTHESLKPYMIEEAYETLEAIDAQDDEKLCEELGDVLLQVMFHARIAKEQGRFDHMDVAGAVCRKMIKRHPHIFASGDARTADEVLRKWEHIKKQEQGHKSHTDVLKHVGKNLPALMRAYKVQGKAAQVGFDFPGPEQAFDKVREEADEFCEAMGINPRKMEDLSWEIGDMLFAVTNVARLLKIDAEQALTDTTVRFILRFEAMEKLLIKDGMNWAECDLQALDAYYEQAKKALAKDADA